MKTYFIVEIRNKYDPEDVRWEAYKSTFRTRVLGIFNIWDEVIGAETTQGPEKCKEYLRKKLAGKDYRIVEKVQI